MVFEIPKRPDAREDLLQPRIRELDSKGLHLILGPRRIGKTTSLKRFASERGAYYLDVLSYPEELTLKQVLAEIGRGTYVIDEFQELRLNGLAYERPEKVIAAMAEKAKSSSVILCGSVVLRQQRSGINARLHIADGILVEDPYVYAITGGFPELVKRVGPKEAKEAFFGEEIPGVLEDFGEFLREELKLSSLKHGNATSVLSAIEYIKKASLGDHVTKGDEFRINAFLLRPVKPYRVASVMSEYFPGEPAFRQPFLPPMAYVAGAGIIRSGYFLEAVVYSILRRNKKGFPPTIYRPMIGNKSADFFVDGKVVEVKNTFRPERLDDLQDAFHVVLLAYLLDAEPVIVVREPVEETVEVSFERNYREELDELLRPYGLDLERLFKMAKRSYRTLGLKGLPRLERVLKLRIIGRSRAYKLFSA